jgi:hypothetical protein
MAHPCQWDWQIPAATLVWVPALGQVNSLQNSVSSCTGMGLTVQPQGLNHYRMKAGVSAIVSILLGES